MIAEEIEIPSPRFNKLQREMAHWLVVAKTLYALKDETAILELLAAELRGRNRYYVVQRIYAHYNSVRRKRELKELQTWKVKNPPNDISQNESQS